MPQEPKKRHSRQRQGKRRAHIKLALLQFVVCENCKKPSLPHTVCKHCGYYGERAVIVMKEKRQERHEEEERPKT